MVGGHQFAQATFQFRLAAVDDVRLLQVRGKAVAVQLRPGGEGAPDVPGVHRATDRPMHQMHGVRNGVEHHPRPAEHAGALADRTGRALLAACDLAPGFPVAENLGAAFVKDGGVMRHGDGAGSLSGLWWLF